MKSNARTKKTIYQKEKKTVLRSSNKRLQKIKNLGSDPEINAIKIIEIEKITKSTIEGN